MRTVKSSTACHGMASCMVYTFTFESMIHGYHEYQLIRGAPAVGEELTCCCELGNSHDPYAVAVKKRLAEKKESLGTYH